ncbi:Macrocin-O-methyltransferase [Rhabdaerophilaceae bacterium]
MSANKSALPVAAEIAGFREVGRSTSHEMGYREKLSHYIEGSSGSMLDKFENFPKYLPRQNVARYLALYEIFKLVLPVQGDVIEGGVNWGGGLMWFAQMSAALEPFNLQRRIIGFDTFSGFPDLHAKDIDAAQTGKEHRAGGYFADSHADLIQSTALFDQNRPIGHVEKVKLVKGDACLSMPAYLSENPHTLVSLLHLDFDIYEPTKVALDVFLPRMVKGSVIVFDEINCPKWPGETLAVVEKLSLRDVQICRFPFEPYISYAIL